MMRDGSRSDHVALGWQALSDWLEASSSIPTEAVSEAQAVMALALDAFPFVHVDDWLVGKTPDGLTFKGWLGIGTSQMVQIDVENETVRMTTDPELVEPFVAAFGDEAGTLGWFSEAAVAAQQVCGATVKGTVLDAKALGFVCRRTGAKASGWAEAKFETNVRRNVLRILDNKGNPMGPWLHPPLGEAPPDKWGRRIPLNDTIGWVAMCEQMGLVRFDAFKDAEKPRQGRAAKADPNASAVGSMDFVPGPEEQRRRRMALPTVKSDPEVEDLMRLWDSAPDVSKFFK